MYAPEPRRTVSYQQWQVPSGIVMQISLVDAGPPDNALPLALRWGTPDPTLAFLRRLPVVGRFAPRPQRPHWGVPAVYRLQLSGGDAVLLDANPED